MSQYPEIFQCLVLQNKDTLLLYLHTGFQIRKTTKVQFYQQIHRQHLKFTNLLPDVAFSLDLETYVTCTYHVSSVFFSLEQFLSVSLSLRNLLI